ncbi:SulP family inorganic anion transporter [Herbidospora sp. RD11066]
MIQMPMVISDLRNYRRAWLRGDLLAGLTVAGYLVPQVMAYATVAGLPLVAGLWAVLPALALYPFLGSSRQLSMGPESSTALMTAVTIGPLAAGDPVRYAQLAGSRAARSRPGRTSGSTPAGNCSPWGSPTSAPGCCGASRSAAAAAERLWV